METLKKIGSIVSMVVCKLLQAVQWIICKLFKIIPCKCDHDCNCKK